MTTKKQLVVFDFDWSMADQDTDRWVHEVLAPDIRRTMEDRDGSAQWTDIVADALHELSDPSRHVLRADIEAALRQTPFHPAMKRAIQHLKSSTDVDTTVIVLSNANTFFIQTILEHQGIRGCFDTIITNPADFSAPENPHRLVLRRRVAPTDTPHGCQIGCEENMCKGQELDRYLDAKRRSHIEFDRVVYIGDGKNDFCPVLRLRSQDIICCRKSFGLERKIAEETAKGDASRLRCNVEPWSGAWEIEEKFTSFAKRASLGDVN